MIDLLMSILLNAQINTIFILLIWNIFYKKKQINSPHEDVKIKSQTFIDK